MPSINTVSTKPSPQTLAQTEDVKNRFYKAQGSKSPQELDALSKDGIWTIRAAVGRNLNTAKETLERLYYHEADYRVRCAVVANPNAPLQILEDTLYDPVNKVRVALTANPNVPSEILSHEMMYKSIDWEVRYGVAFHKNTPQEILNVLYKDPEMTVRWGVSQNTSAHPQVLHILAQDRENLFIRDGVANNTSAANETLLMLLKDSNKQVREAAQLQLRQRMMRSPLTKSMKILNPFSPLNILDGIKLIRKKVFEKENKK
ncbi:MAG: hypothetical protein ABIH00_09190 [Armatimonadota bacterium]